MLGQIPTRRRSGGVNYLKLLNEGGLLKALGEVTGAALTIKREGGRLRVHCVAGAGQGGLDVAPALIALL